VVRVRGAQGIPSAATGFHDSFVASNKEGYWARVATVSLLSAGSSNDKEQNVGSNAWEIDSGGGEECVIN
jgi:hypothetical protein